MDRALATLRAPGPAALPKGLSAPTLERVTVALRDCAEGEGNLLHPIKDALRAGASIGEVSGAMRDVFGEYRGGAFF